MKNTMNTEKLLVKAVILSVQLPQNPREGFLAKPLDSMQKLGSISLLQRMVQTFHLAGVQDITLIAKGKEEKKLTRFADQNGLSLLFVPDSEESLPDLLQAAMKSFSSKYDSLLFALAQAPLFSASTVRKLLDFPIETITDPLPQTMHSPLVFVFPRDVSGDRMGFPFRMHTHKMLQHLETSGDSHKISDESADCWTWDSMATFFGRSGLIFRELPVEDAGIWTCVDQKEACERLILTHNRDCWHPLTKVLLARESTFLGPGSWRLLFLIKQTGSVRLACEEMNMSYSKAWKMLNHAETQTGFALVTRRHGGKDGGETFLTEEGEKLLSRYQNFRLECQQAVDGIFEKYFTDTEDS